MWYNKKSKINIIRHSEGKKRKCELEKIFRKIMPEKVLNLVEGIGKERMHFQVSQKDTIAIHRGRVNISHSIGLVTTQSHRKKMMWHFPCNERIVYLCYDLALQHPLKGPCAKCQITSLRTCWKVKELLGGWAYQKVVRDAPLQKTLRPKAFCGPPMFLNCNQVNTFAVLHTPRLHALP